MASTLPKGEIAPHKVAAIFDTAAQATEAAVRVRQALGMGEAQVRVITPDTPRPGRALEPETRGIFSLMLRAHAALAVAGFLAGVLLYFTLRAMGLPLVVRNPIAAASTIIAFCTAGGMMLAGLATLRPDHDAYILSVLDACREGRSATVVHARTSDELATAREALEATGGRPISTL